MMWLLPAATTTLAALLTALTLHNINHQEPPMTHHYAKHRTLPHRPPRWHAWPQAATVTIGVAVIILALVATVTLIARG